MTAAPEKPAIDDCWNSIGVWRHQAPPCPKLEEFIHCHNCDVYAEAGHKLRDRPVPPDYPEQWRSHYARTLSRRDEFGRLPILVFRIGGEWLALAASTVEEIIDPVPVHSLPHRSSGFLRGIVNIHGRLHLCVSLDELLGIDGSTKANEEKHRIYPRMVILRREEICFAFLADEVWGTHRYAPSDLSEIPATLARASAKISLGVLSLDDTRIGLLDAALLFHLLEQKLG